jgi:hypothetical protein
MPQPVGFANMGGMLNLAFILEYFVKDVFKTFLKFSSTSV